MLTWLLHLAGDRLPIYVVGMFGMLVGHLINYLMFGLDALLMRRRVRLMLGSGALTADQADRILGKDATTTARG